LLNKRIYNAKSDLEEARELDPENKEISEELEKIKSVSL